MAGSWHKGPNGRCHWFEAVPGPALCVRTFTIAEAAPMDDDDRDRDAYCHNCRKEIRRRKASDSATPRPRTRPRTISESIDKRSSR